MNVLYVNQQDDLDSMNGAVIADGARLAELLDGRRKKPPFLARLSGENGFELMIGIGGRFGCVQHSRSDGEPPYLMAVSPNPPKKKRRCRIFHCRYADAGSRTTHCEI